MWICASNAPRTGSVCLAFHEMLHSCSMLGSLKADVCWLPELSGVCGVAVAGQRSLQRWL